jgi:putative flippase GtrA
MSNLKIQIVKYFFIGIFCVSLDMSLFLLEIDVFGVKPALANLISSHVGIFASYFLNSRYTFEVVSFPAARFLSFYMVGFIGYLFGHYFLVLGTRYTSVPIELIKISSYLGIFLIQFLINKLVTFGELTADISHWALTYILSNEMFGLPVDQTRRARDVETIGLALAHMELFYRLVFAGLLGLYAGGAWLVQILSLRAVKTSHFYAVARNFFPFKLIIRWLRSFYLLSSLGASRG